MEWEIGDPNHAIRSAKSWQGADKDMESLDVNESKTFIIDDKQYGVGKHSHGAEFLIFVEKSRYSHFYFLKFSNI
jgi:hypothetical protein